MKFLIFLFVASFNLQAMELNLQATQNEKMKLLIGLVGESSTNLKVFAENLKNDLEFSGQFKVSISEFAKIKTKKEIADLANQDYMFAIFINKLPNKIGIDWKLYDTSTVTMLKGKKLYQENGNLNALSHKLADELWFDLAGRESSFYASISACKKVNKKHTHLHVFHPTEYCNGLSKSEPIVTEPTTILFSCWHPKKTKIYYSKHSKYNVRLMSVNALKEKSLVSNFDGINLIPAFSKNGRIVIPITISGKGRLFEYTFDPLDSTRGVKGRNIFKPLTNSNIHAINPSFIDENKIIFCSINELGQPKIAILNNDKVEYLGLQGLSCNYNSKNNKIVFCKKEGSYYQLFIYDLASKISSQLTKCKSDKDGCSWSPCGNYVIFTCEKKNKHRIAVFNIWTNELRYLTPEHEDWTSASWSPIYNEIPFYLG